MDVMVVGSPNWIARYPWHCGSPARASCAHEKANRDHYRMVDRSLRRAYGRRVCQRNCAVAVNRSGLYGKAYPSLDPRRVGLAKGRLREQCQPSRMTLLSLVIQLYIY